MADTKPLKDKVILITGAGQGIGESTARYLAARGAILSLSDISKTTVDAVAQSIRDEFPDSLAFSQVVDVRDPAAVKGWVDMTKERFGRINGCVNNAGEQLCYCSLCCDRILLSYTPEPGPPLSLSIGPS